MKSGKKDYLVSAIVSTYDAEHFIGGCLEDLEAQTIADQTEIIVIDSASEQNEGAIVRSYQQKYKNIRYVRTAERQTVYGAWNHGISFAKGEYITNANTDDRHRKDAFEQMVAVLDDRPDIVLVYADAYKTQDDNQSYDQCVPSGRLSWFDFDRSLLLQKGCFMGPQPMWRKKVHEIFGGFNENLVSSGDYEFWLRISQLFEFQHLNLPLGVYLERESSVEHANANLKVKEDLAIQAEYLQAAIHKRLIHCQLLERLHRLLAWGDPQLAREAADCMAGLEMLICPDVQGRRGSAHKETDNFLKLKYRIQSGLIPPAQVDQVIDELAQLMLISTRWYRHFWGEALRSKPGGKARKEPGAVAASKMSQQASCPSCSGICIKDKGITLT